jgi:putative ABC transport system permease protein
MDSLIRNLRYAARSLARAPAFTLTVVLTLGLGIGANGAVFSALNAVLLRPLPLPDADRLVKLNEARQDRTGNVAPARLEDWNERNSTFEALTGSYSQDISDTSGDLPERLRQATVAPRFLDVWRVAPMLGRGFVPADHVPGSGAVVMISQRYWERRFHSDAAIVGKTITIGADSGTLVGVMPASFTFPEHDVDVWVPLVYFPYVKPRYNAWLQGYGRLRPGVALEQARADLDVVQRRLASEFPDTDRDMGVHTESLKDTVVGTVRSSLWLLFASVSVLLLIACTNIAALLLSRATRREQEIAVRFSLGSSRWAVASQVLTETALLASLGAVVGLGIAVGASFALRTVAAGFPRIDELAVDTPTLLYTALTVFGVTALCGLAPALRSARAGGVRVARSGRGQVSGRHSLQWLFVGVQVSLSVALLAGAGLLVRSFQELGRVDPGFDPNRVLTFRVSGSYGQPRSQMAQDVNAMLDSLRGVPGVEAAATSSPVPGVLNDHSGFEFTVQEFQIVEGTAEPDQMLQSESRVVSPSYFGTMKIPLVAGEPCRFRVPTPGAQEQEILVNQAFASRFFPERSAVGLHIKQGTFTSRILGVVGDAREYRLDRVPTPTFYTCVTAIAYPPLSFLLRTAGDPSAIVGAVRQRMKEIEPSRSVYDVVPLTERIGAEYAQDRLRTALVVLFAGAALSLVCLGIYGTLSYIVSQRRREVGLRVALGALSSTIVAQFVTQALRVVGVACAVGLVLSLAFGRALSGLLFGVSPFDPLTLAGVVVLVVGVAALAAFLPSLRASRIDPMEALREE